MNRAIPIACRRLTCMLPGILLAPLAQAAPPDVLGITPGMPAAAAYEVVKAQDVGHRVKVGQFRIPELLGDKPAVYALTTDTRDPANVFYVNLTLPPDAQRVWQVYHQVGPLHITKDQALASLVNKYGAKYRSRLPFTTVGTFRWIFDEQGNLSDMPFSQEGTCQQTANPINPLGTPIAGGPADGLQQSAQPDVQMRTVPHVYDPAAFPQCQHLVWVDAQIQGNDLTWTITVTVSDFDLEHRSAITLMNFFNDLAGKKRSQDVNQAEHTQVPKL
ncbi:MAG: hypothetical protein JSS29_00800 [Proteobacteria bacterium]|nr:hypothetical protein [Pseudomonadota bacterium]